MIPNLLTIPLALAMLLIAPAVSQAQTYNYTSTGSGSATNDGAGSWSTTVANWILVGSAGSAGNWVQNKDAIIGNGGTPGAITCAGSIVVGNVTFNPVASGNYTFSSGSIRVGGGGAHGNVSTFFLPSGVSADFGNNGGSGQFLAQGSTGSGIAADGGGTLLLTYTAASTYTGPTTIQGGTKVLVGAGFVSSASSALNLTSGTLGAFNSTARTWTKPVNLNGNFTLGAPSPRNGNLTFGTGAWTLSGGSWTLTVDTISAAINSSIGGSGLGLGFSSANSGTLTLGLSGTEGYTGPTTINSGTLALGVSCNLNAASGVAIAAGGTFDVSAQATWTAGSSASPAITASGTSTAATIKGGTTVALGTRPITLNYDGADDTMLTISQGALTMNGNTITINTNNTTTTFAHGLHNIIAVTGGSITLAAAPSVTGTAMAPTDSVVAISTTGGTPNYVQIDVETTPVIPVLNAVTKSAITNSSATLGATLVTNYSLAITNYGIVWNTSPNPTTANNKVQFGTTTPAMPSAFTVSATGLPAATTIYYRGYAANSAGTGYSTNDTFLTLANEPATQATGVSGYSLQNGNLTISWTRGNGSKCIVLVKSGSAVDANPVDATSYTANATFGSGTQIGTGNYVAYLGTGTSVTLSALSAATTYYVAVYELSGSGGSENYLAPPATGSQTTVTTPISVITWNGSADTDWNNTNNWDALVIPDVGTPVSIPTGTANPPIYSNPTVAASIGSVTNSGVLTIATNGFKIDAASAVALTVQAGGTVTINTNGVLTVVNSSSASMVTPASGTSPVIDVEGGSLLMTNNSGTFFMGDATGSEVNVGAVFTNNNGTVVIDKQLRVRGRDSKFYMSGGTLDLQGGLNHDTEGNDSRQFFTIAGGKANLNAVTIYRAALNTGGLFVNGGVVNSSSMRIGIGIASANSRMDNGLWTNAGAFYIGDRNNPATGARNTYFVMNGGDLVTLGADGIVINNQGQTTLSAPTDDGGNLVMNGGTITTEGIYLNGTNVTANAWARFQMSAGTVYLGAVGLVANTAGASMNADITLTGGTLAAKSDWTSVASIPLGGVITFKAADAANTAHNITLNGALTGGAGTLVKTGAGTLALNSVNTYSSATTISAGTLAVGASGTLPNTTPITVASGATFDASAPGGFTLASGKLLGGSGTVVGAFTAASGSTITVGDSVGTLTFSGGLTLANSVLVNFEISSTTNDLVVTAGNLDISGGTTTISVTPLGGVLAGGTYTLFHYGSSLIGNVSNLSLVGAPGYLTNNAAAQSIQLVTTGLRAPGNAVWVGNSSVNNWDVLNHTNWLNSGALSSFVQGDTVLFDATGAAHPSVNIVNPVNPASLTVDAAASYIFSGSGAIGGSGGLTKTNTGTLVVLTTNSYTGPTIIGQGTLEISTLANGGANSGIGAANNSTNNLMFYSSTLRYTGASASTDRGATLNDAGGTINVTNSSTILTDNGTLVGTGVLTKTGLGTLVLGGANTHAGGTVVTNGILQINNVTSLGSGAFTNVGATLKFGSGFTASETVNFTGNCIIDLNSPAVDAALRGAWSGSGTVLITNLNSSARTFTIGGDGNGGGAMTDFAGTINCGNCVGDLRFNDGSQKNYGSPNAFFNLGNGGVRMVARNGGVTIDLGALAGGPNTRLAGRASGSSGILAYSIGALGIDTTFAGTITNFNNATAIIKVGTGRLTLSGTNYHTGSTTVSDGELRVDGSILTSVVTVNGGKLSGAGTIGGATTLNPFTTLSAGSDSVGTLTFSGALTLDGTSTNSFAVTSSGGVSNSVSVAGALTPNASLIKITSGTALAVGTYTLFNYAGGISGPFNATPVFDVAPAASASIVDTGSQIRLVIGTPTPPSISSIITSGNDIILNAVGGTPSGSVSVLTSTNLALPLASWTIVTSGNFDGSGNFNYTVSGALSSGQPKQFYILQTP